MAFQGLFTGGVKIRNLNGYLIAVNGEVFATTNTGGTTYAFFYQAKTSITSGDPGSGHIIWNNATQTSATQINVSHLTDTPVEDIDIYLTAIVPGNRLIIQDRDDSERFQIWTVSGAPTQVGTDYWTIPVTLVQSQGAAFTNNHDLLFAIVSGGSGGGGTTTNSITFNNGGSGAASGTSFNGGVPVTVSYNTIGAQVASANLTSLAGLSYASTAFVKMTGANTFTLDTNTYLTANQTITLSGDGSGSGTTAITLTLATVNSNVGTFNNVTVNAKGLVTSASNVSYLTANQTITLSGNVTGSGTTSITTTIANNVVTNAMLAQIATARIRGRVTAGTGNVEDLTGTQVTTLLDSFAGSVKGLVPVSVGGTTNFLRADGTWAAPAGGGGSPAGSNTQIQYNNSGAFGASANLTWDNSTQNLAIGSGTAPAYITMLANNTSNGWGGRIIADNPTGQFIFQHRNNSATFVNCWLLNANSGVAQTYFLDRVFISNNPGNSAVLVVNSSTDNGVDKLQVSGSAIASTLKVNTSGQTLTFSNYYNGGNGRNIWIGGGGLSSNSAAWGNTSLGDGALLSITSGFFNTAIGASALQLHTTGDRNMAIGFEALYSTTSGTRNVGIGVNALATNSTGSNNMAIGTAALLLSTTAGDNCAIGSDALREITTGANNVAIGTDAGRRISGGSANQTSGTSIYIGQDTRSSANGNTNEIVIGHNAIGQGSNTVTLGNSSITQTLLRGTVTGGSFVKSGGTSAQILAADGSVITAGTGITISGGTISSTGGGGGTTTFAVTFNNSGTGAASGTTFDGSVARTISYNTLGANKVITSGTAAPTGGVDGDIYLQYDVSLLTGSGTTNYVPKFTSSTAIGNSQIFDNGTSVGIGTASPGARLQVGGSTSASQVRVYGGSAGTSSPELQLYGASSDNNWTLRGNHNTDFSIGQGTFGNYGTQLFTLTSAGNVGIGTTSPGNKVDIFTTNRTALNTVGSGLNVNYNGSTTGEFATIGFSWASSLGNISTQWGIGMVGTNFSAGTAALNLFTNGAERMRIDASGNVGIGYTAPAARLAVNGRTLINTNTDNGVDALQVSGSALVTGNFVAASSSGNVSLRTTASTYAVNINTGANSAIGFYEDGTQSTIIGQNQNLSTTNALSIRGANLDLVGIGATYVRIITNSNERLRIVSAGRILMGTITDNGTDILQVNGNVTATQYSSTVQTLTDSATITFNANNGSNAVVTLGGNRTLAFSNTRTGAYYTLRVIQDGTGSRTLAMPGTVKVIGGGAGVITLSTAANSVDIISFYFDGTNYWASYGQNYT